MAFNYERPDGSIVICGDITADIVLGAAEAVERKGYRIESFSSFMRLITEQRRFTDSKSFDADLAKSLRDNIISAKN
jgi:hypothetical protein